MDMSYFNHFLIENDTTLQLLNQPNVVEIKQNQNKTQVRREFKIYGDEKELIGIIEIIIMNQNLNNILIVHPSITQ